MNQSIKPGQPWLDTNGVRIQAHAGYMLYVDGTFYWYGENKEKSVSEYEIWHWGVRLYSSRDLYNWQDEGLIMFPTPEDPNSPLHPQSKMDRPHIIYNEKTKKYVLWMKVMGPDMQYMSVAVADTIKGPFEIVNKKLHPGGMNSGDFDLVKFEDGKAVIVFERVHKDMIVMDLTDDYLDTTVIHSVHYERPFPPYVREAPAVFFRKGKGYIITSGTTAKMPNPSETATFDDIHGEWKILGNPHVDDAKNTSFDSQISCVFRHPRYEDLYIAMADRWLNDLTPDKPTGVEYYAALFDENYPMTPERRTELRNMSSREITARNTAMAEYVWLPIVFENDVPKIYWSDEWTIEDAGTPLGDVETPRHL